MSERIDPLSVACDEMGCGALELDACWSVGTTQHREPHSSRVAKARAALLDRAKRSESQWLELAEIWRDASEADRAGIFMAVKVRMACLFSAHALWSGWQTTPLHGRCPKYSA